MLNAKYPTSVLVYYIVYCETMNHTDLYNSRTGTTTTTTHDDDDATISTTAVATIFQAINGMPLSLLGKQRLSSHNDILYTLEGF